MTSLSTETSPRKIARKICCSCKHNRALSNYSKNKKYADGLAPNCRDCKALAKKKHLNKKRVCGGCQTSSKPDFDYDDDGYCISCTPLMFLEKGVDFQDPPPPLSKEEIRAFAIFNDIRKRAKRTGKRVDISWLWVIERLERGKCEVTKRRYRVPLHGRSVSIPYVALIDLSGDFTEDNCRIIARSEKTKVSAGVAARLEKAARGFKNA